MAITAERLEVDVTADTSSAQRDLDRFQSRTNATVASSNRAGGSAAAMGGKFKTAATLVKAAAGTMVASMAGKTVMAASDLNEVMSKTGVVFGPQADLVTDAAQKMADQFGISKATYLDAASGIGQVGKASGLTQKAAAGLSTEFASLAADASSFYDVPIEEALAAMKSGLVGESEPMRQFGVLLSEAAVKAEAARLGIADMGAELTEGQKVQARASLITKGMADANGDLARTQDSVANRLREIRGRLTNFAADMGTKALPAAEKFLSALIKAPKVIGAMVSSVKDYLTTNASWKPVLDAAKAALDGLVVAVKAVPGIFSGAASGVQGFLDKYAWLKPVLDTAGVAVAAFVAAFLAVMAIGKVVVVIKAITLAIRGLFLAMAANPVGLIIAGLVALGVAVYAAYKRFEPFRNLVNTVGAALRNGLGVALDWVKAKWAAWGPAIMQALTMVWSTIQAYVGMIITYWRTMWNIVSTVVQAVFNAVKSYIQFMLPIWKAAFQAMWGVVKAVFNAIKGVVRAGLQVIKGVIKAVTSAIRGDWRGVWQGIKQVLTGVWNGIKAVVKGAIGVVKSVISGGLGVIKSVWSRAWGAIKGVLNAAWKAIKKAVSDAIGDVTSTVKSLKRKVTGALEGIGSWLASAGRDLIRGMVNGVKEMAGNLADTAKDVVGDAVDAAKSVLKIGSPSKVFREIGHWTIEGLVIGLQKGSKRAAKTASKVAKAVTASFTKGMRGTSWQQKKYLGDLRQWVRKAFGKKDEKFLLKRIKSAAERTRHALKRETDVTARLRAQIARRNTLKEQKREFIDSMAQGISQQANVLNAGNNAGAIRASLEAQVAKAREFAANLKAMAGMGYPKELIAQVAGAGVEGGAEVAKALVAANGSDSKGISEAFNTINQIAKNQSKALGDTLYNPGIQAAQGLIDGLKKKQKSIEQVMVQIAKGMQKAIRKALGIKSPSRVMADMARFIPEGIAKGIKDNARKATGAATQMARGVTSSVTAGLGPTGGPRGPGGGPDGLTPASLGAGRQSGDTHFHFTTNNPVAEPQSRTTNKALDRVASLGLV